MVNYTLTITAAKNLSGEERAATVTVTDPSGKVVHSIAVVQGTYDLLDDYTDLSGGGETANCYLINGVGSYRFPIIKGNGAKGLIRSGDTAELPDATHAKIVWQSQEILSAVDVYKGFVVFETASSFRTGNAVVAVTNDADEILWSWHIWSTGYRLGSNDISVMNHAKTRTYKMMSQTLGQVGSTALLYQFGRKDPFRQQNATNTASGGTLAKSIQHPDVFYTNSGSDWCSESRTDWWDSGCKSYNSSTTSASTLKGNKTIYDPCPVGYRVPPDDAFTSFTTTGTNTDSESQINSPYPGMVDFIQNSNTYLPQRVQHQPPPAILCRRRPSAGDRLFPSIGRVHPPHPGGDRIRRGVRIDRLLQGRNPGDAADALGGQGHQDPDRRRRIHGPGHRQRPL